MGDREYNTDYLWHMKYRNDLPEIPVGNAHSIQFNTIHSASAFLPFKLIHAFPLCAGPFLVEIPKLLHPLEHYGTYYQSSIEKNYVWRPHFPEAGIQVDLWDKESLIVPQDAALRGSLDMRDLKYIQEGQEGSGGRKAASKDIERPWWLRNTTYLEVVSSAEGQKKEVKQHFHSAEMTFIYIYSHDENQFIQTQTLNFIMVTSTDHCMKLIIVI